MVKSRAEIQREYRQRKQEKEGQNYILKERERVKKYYIPISERTKKDAKQRREKVRKAVQKHRKQQKELVLNSQNDACPDMPLNSLHNHTVSTTGPEDNGGLIVKLPFVQKEKSKARTRKRISRISARQRREINKLKIENEKLRRRVNTVSKRFQRAHKRLSVQSLYTKKSVANLDSNEMTPSKRVSSELQQYGISPTKVPNTLKKRLLFASVLSDEIKSAREANDDKGKAIISRIISGRVIKKYKMKREMSRVIGIDRKSLTTISKDCNVPKRRRLLAIHEKMEQTVHEYLGRDDNSRQMPGKKDTKSVKGETKQKRVLNDSLKNLFVKFTCENPDLKIAFPTFCRMRPRHFVLTQYISRNRCLCQKHQNMALLLKSMKSAGATVPLNPEDYIQRIRRNEINASELMQMVEKSEISYEQWKRVECDDGKKRMKIVPKVVSKETLTDFFVKQTNEFQEHSQRIGEQYAAMNLLKKDLPPGHIIVQMDFAENFTCVSADEIQSAYWNQNSITLHPVVAYYQVNGVISHKSYMIVSDDLGHNAGSVFAFLQKLIPQLKEDILNIIYIHYWTDSPSSQYRNKSIFHIVSDHLDLFGMAATWNYFESGHGKGPCDGLGGTAKRMADLAVRQNKCRIQDAKQFFDWGDNCQTSIKYLFVGSEYIATMRTELETLTQATIPLKGTMKTHAVIGLSPGIIRSRTTSCYCKDCLSGKLHADWVETDIRKNPITSKNIPPPCQSVDAATNVAEGNDVEMLTEVEQEIETSETISNPRRIHTPQNGEFVAAVYNKSWYIGKVTEVDDVDETCNITFMEKCSVKGSTCYKWPQKPDELWVDFTSVLCSVQQPTPVGRYGRNYKLDNYDEEWILTLFSAQ